MFQTSFRAMSSARHPLSLVPCETPEATIALGEVLMRQVLIPVGVVVLGLVLGFVG